MFDKEYDVIVVGTGAAGLFAALNVKSDYKILMITKDILENSDSYLAQGGICMLLGDEDYDSYFEDTMRAGRYENNKESVEIMIKSSQDIIKELISYNVDFDKNEDGHFSFTREGAHSTFRILHHKDVTGKEITGKLLEEAKRRGNITISEYTTMVDILEEDNTIKGIVVNANGHTSCIKAKKVILATGGIGGIFEHSTNFRHITGDSFAIAIRHGIEMENINYIQIHPTTLYSAKPGRRFLISESVRGEGAVLLNAKEERFVDELLPRDVVTAAIKKQMEEDNSDYVYLSLIHMPKEEIIYRFPNIYEHCLMEGYDLSKDYIPVTPAQHYLMGGIKTDTYGRTSVKGLFAVGETACNGVHGANRLASNSLLESLVYAKRAAVIVNNEIKDCDFAILQADEKEYIEEYSAMSMDEWFKLNKKTILDEIKRKDREFYDKWCNNEN
ncbi:MAG: L-aspartate oxidase [Lachnospiraceae bacterium]|nr:L-aspartate oxidase [Lachnospiraceae bacterium]